MKNFMKKNSKLLQSCLSVDFFKIHQTIPVYGKHNYKSLLGVSVTYIQLILTFFAFFYFGRELFVKENPILIITENRLSLDNNHELDFERDNLWMNFGVFNDNKFMPIDETYFNIFGEHKIYVPSKKVGEYAIKTTIFDLEQCSFDYLRKSHGSETSIVELQYIQSFSYCFTNKIKAVNFSDNFPEEKKLNSSHMSIKGFFGSKEFSFINVKYSKCINKTDQIQPVCKTPDEINRMLSTVFIGGKIINNYLKPMSYKNPINLDNEWFYSKVSLANKKQLNLKLQRNVLVSDSGIFLTVEEPTVFFSLASTYETQAINENSYEDFVFCTSLYFDKVEKVYSRRYKKIEDVFAQVGGALKSSLIIFSILLKPLTSKSFKLNILFEFLKDKRGSAKEKQRPSFDKKMKENVSKGYDEFLKIIDLNNIIRYMVYTKSLLIYLFPSGKRKQFKRKCEGELRKKIYHIIQGNPVRKLKIEGSEQELNKLQTENKIHEPFDKNQIWGIDSKTNIGATPYVDDMSFHDIRVNEPIKINHFQQWNESSERQKS